jgi:hypothetical protein
MRSAAAGGGSARQRSTIVGELERPSPMPS